MVDLGKDGCIQEKVVVFRQSDCILATVVVLGKKYLNSGKSGCIRTKMFVFGQSGCNPAEAVLFGQKWLYWDKEVLFVEKSLY